MGYHLYLHSIFWRRGRRLDIIRWTQISGYGRSYEYRVFKRTEVKPTVTSAPQSVEQAPVTAITEPEQAAVSEVVAPAPPTDIESIVRSAARTHGIDENHFAQIARCESTFNPNAVNTAYYENGHPSGLFQHISGYWPARAAKYGYGGASVFDPVANANVTAQMFRDGLSGLWECH